MKPIGGFAAAAAAAVVLGWIPPELAADPAKPRYPDGATTFQANCAVCHGPKGLGTPSLAPPITSYPARYASIAEGRRQLALTVLNGMFGGIDVDGKHYDFKMPDFSQLDDAALAAVLNFVVFDVAGAAEDIKPLSPEDIAAERGHPLEGAAVREHRAKVLAALGL
jgi:mono/diheme cytochrome c family protein